MNFIDPADVYALADRLTSGWVLWSFAIGTPILSIAVWLFRSKRWAVISLLMTVFIAATFCAYGVFREMLVNQLSSEDDPMAAQAFRSLLKWYSPHWAEAAIASPDETDNVKFYAALRLSSRGDSFSNDQRDLYERTRIRPGFFGTNVFNHGIYRTCIFRPVTIQEVIEYGRELRGTEMN